LDLAKRHVDLEPVMLRAPAHLPWWSKKRHRRKIPFGLFFVIGGVTLDANSFQVLE